MHQLLLLRHAKSSWDDPKLSDHARPIDARGRRAVALIRAAAREFHLAPDLVLVSSARRTLQTLEGLEPWDDTPLIEPLDELYLASADKLLQMVRGVRETVRTLMLIGHNPGLHDLAMAIVGGEDGSISGSVPPSASSGPLARRLVAGYPAGALAEFTVPGPWEDLAPGGGRLVRFLCPNDMTEMAN